MNVSVSIQDKASPGLLAEMRGVRSPDFLRVGARGIANLCRTHFDQLDQARANELGGRRTHFWRAVKKSVQNPVVAGTTATVSINHVGVRQRLQGGVIRPGKSINPKTGRPTRFLAIPLRSEAYGIRPAERDDLDYIPAKEAGLGSAVGGVLVESHKTLLKRVRRKDGIRMRAAGEVGGLALYALVTRVYQAPDPSVLPTSNAMGSAAVAAMSQLLAARAARPGGLA
jgi:hypothetical protein